MAVKTPTGVDALLAADAFFDNPYQVYGRLRSEAPVVWSERWNCWVITRYADILAMLRDHRHFSNVGRHAAHLKRLPVADQEGLASLATHYAGGGLSNQDPPAHTRLRGLVAKAFTPRVVAGLRPRIQQIVDDLLDRVSGVGQFDVIRDFSYPLPAIVIAELIGLPPEDRDQFKTWSDEITAFLGTGRADSIMAERGQRSLIELRAYFGELVKARRRQPRDDLLSGLIAAEERGDVLNDGELLGSCVTILLGGHETSTNLIGNGLLALLRTPDQWWRLRHEPGLIPSAVEEFLRYDAPVQRIWRIVGEDVTISGQTLRAGESVFLMVGAANRDPAQFPDPDRLDVGRQPNRHLTFGHAIHFCLGAPLARLEAAIAFAALIRRFPNLRASTDDVSFHPNVAFRGLRSLPVVVSTADEGGRPM